MIGGGEIDQTAVTTIFKKLPWHTNVLAHLDDPQVVPEEMEPYLKALGSGFDKQVGPDLSELKAFFQGQTDAISTNPLYDSPFTPYNRGQTASIVVAYRLLDVYACDRSPPVQNSSLEKYGFKDPPHTNYKQLYNWGNLVLQSSALFEGVVNRSVATAPDDRPSTPSLRTYRHFIALCRTQVDKRKIIPQANFETAALHLSYLFEGNADLPDSSEAFVSDMQSRKPPETGPIGKPFRSYNMQQLRSPLHTAVLISPLCLVGNFNLNRVTPGRPTLIQVWQGLGSSRPDSLKWAESQLWGLLWDYTLEKIDLMPNLHTTLKRIVARVSDSIPISELTWFTPLPFIAPPKKLRYELKNLRLTPPPTYSDSDVDEKLFDTDVLTPIPSSSPAATRNGPVKIPNDVHLDTGETTSETESDEDEDVYRPNKPIVSKPSTKKRRKSATSKRKAEKISKSKSGTKTPSTQTLPHPSRASVLPPYIEVIDLSRDNKFEHVPRLGPVVGYQKTMGVSTHHLYSAVKGPPDLYTPQSHLKEDVQWLTQIVKNVESHYVKGKPRFITDPENSVFFIISEDYFRRLTDRDIQDILKARHIVVTGRRLPPHGFDADGLETLTGLELPISIYDQSIPMEDDAVRVRNGNLLDLYTSAGSSHGKSLITLELPMSCAPPPPKSFASDIKAWSTTLDHSHQRHEFPTQSTKWGQVATAGAYYKWRVHRDGFATYIDSQAGSQYLVVARPKKLTGWDDAFWKDIQHMRKYTTEDGSSEDPDASLWEFEAILLKPGGRLIMRPNSPHLAITPDPSISHGGRFFGTSTIRESCFGVFYTFLFSPKLDPQHSVDSRTLLRRLLVYYHGILTTDNPTVRERNDAHIPRVNTFRGMLDLLTLCNVVEMGNILTPKLYTDKDKCNRERHELIEARKVSRAMVDWLFDHYQLSLNGSLVPKSRQVLYWPYLAHQAKTLLWFKEQTEKGSAPTGPHQYACTYEAVKLAIRGCFRTVVPFWTAWDNCRDTQLFAWSGPPFDVITREPTIGPREHDGKTIDDLVWLGESDETSDADDSFGKVTQSEDERSNKRARYE